MSRDQRYGYDKRPDPPGRFVPGGSPPSRVNVPPKDKEREGGDLGEKTAGRIFSEDGLFKVEPEEHLLTVLDEAETTRVLLGRLGLLTTDYGLEVYNESGGLILGATGLGINVVGTDQLADSAVTSLKLASGSVTTEKLGDQVVTRVKLDSGLTVPEVVNALPTLPDPGYADGALVVLTTDWKLYRNAGGTWTVAVPTSDLTGTIAETQITDGAISTPKLAANAVTAAKVAAGTITANEIAANTLTAGQIAAGAIGAAEIAAGAVITAKLAAGAVTANEIAANTITANKLLISTAHNLIPNADFRTGDTSGWRPWSNGSSINVVSRGDASVPAGAPTQYVCRLGPSSGTQFSIFTHESHYSSDSTDGVRCAPGERFRIGTTCAAASGTTTDFHLRAYYQTPAGTSYSYIAGRSPSTSWAEIGGEFVAPADCYKFHVYHYAPALSGTWAFTQSIVQRVQPSTLIEDAAIVTAKIADLAVGTAKIANLNVTSGKIADLAVTTAKIANLDVTEGKIASLAVSNGKIQDAAISTAKIGNLQVTEGKIASLAVTNAKIADLAVTTAKIANLDVTEGKIANLAVSNGKIADAAITTAKIGNLQVTTAKINDLNVTSGKIASLAVTNAKIADLAVTTAKIANLDVTEGKIANLAVSTGKIQDLAVSTAKIASLAVTDAKINDLNATKITAGTINAARIGTGSITAAKLSADSVTAAKLAAVAIETGKYIQSTTYSPGSAGWTINADGSAEFNNVTVRGTLDGVTGTFAGTVTGDTFTATEANFNNVLLAHGGNNAYIKAFDINNVEQARITCTTGAGLIYLGTGSTSGNEGIRYVTSGTIASPSHWWRIWADGSDVYFDRFDGTTNTIMKVNSAGGAQFPTIATTSAGANAHLASTNLNRLMRSTSSRRYKTNIVGLTLADARSLATGLRPVKYTSTSKADDPTQEFVGFIAEEVDLVDSRFVYRIEDPENPGSMIPDAVAYDRLVVPLALVTADHEVRVRSLEQEVKALRDRIAVLEAV